jgi:hypothetical protein
VRSPSLQPDDLLTIPWMASSIDSMRFVSSAHAILATGLSPFPWWVYLPLETSAFSWTYCSAPFSQACGLSVRTSSATRLTYTRLCDRIITHANGRGVVITVCQIRFVNRAGNRGVLVISFKKNCGYFLPKCTTKPEENCRLSCRKSKNRVIR